MSITGNHFASWKRFPAELRPYSPAEPGDKNIVIFHDCYIQKKKTTFFCILTVLNISLLRLHTWGFSPHQEMLYSVEPDVINCDQNLLELSQDT